MGWLDEALDHCVLSERVEGYLLGRGAKEKTIEEMGFVEWSPMPFESPDPVFCKRYLPTGLRMAGRLVIPLYSPRGKLIGVQFRDIDNKDISRFLLPSAYWNPIWIGSRRATPKLWAGGGVWIVEGAFDLFPLEWVVPPTDGILGAITAGLSYKQVAYLKRIKPPFVNVVFDRDKAGRNGTRGYIDKDGRKVRGAIETLTHAGLRCRDYPYGRHGDNDPGEIWDRGGIAAIRQAFRR